MAFVSFKAREYQYREYDFVAYISRTPSSFLYLGLIDRDSMSITIEDVRSVDEEAGGELLYYKVSIEFKCVQLNLTTVKGIENYEELTKGKWYLYLQCVQDRTLSFSTPIRVGLSTQQIIRYNEHYTLVKASFLTEKIDWLKGDRFSDPIFVQPTNDAKNVAINTQIIFDVEQNVIFDFEVAFANTTLIRIENIFSTNGKINGNTEDSRINIANSPVENWKRITITIPALEMGTKYKVNFVGRKFGYTARTSIVFSTFLSAPTFVSPPTPNDNNEYLFLDQFTVRTQRTNAISQQVIINIQNTTNPANPINVLQTQRAYNTTTNFSLDFSWKPTQYGKYTIQVKDRTIDVDSQIVSRNVIFTDKYEELVARSNVLLAWNSLKVAQTSGVVFGLLLDGQGLLGVRPYLNLPSNWDKRPLLVTDSSHRNYPVMYAQGLNQRHLYANTTLFTGLQIAVFLLKKTNSYDLTLFGANIPYVGDWRVRSFSNNFVGQSYWSPSTGERFDNVFNLETYEKDANGNIVQIPSNIHPLNKWALVAFQYNIPISVANFALFGAGQQAASQDAYLSIGFIISSDNWNDRLDFVNYLKLFL